MTDATTQSPTSARSTKATQSRRRLAWLGPALIAAIAVLSAAIALVMPAPKRESVTMWTFARMHADLYRPEIEAWNDEQTDSSRRVELSLIGVQAMEQRMMSAFLAGLPSADLIEAERRNAARAFAGPLESVGFLDLTPYVERDGIMNRVNAASFKPWTKDGRIFGLPHDVHPMMLAYRADIVEAAGIDVSKIETWDDFVRVMRPLLFKENGERRTDRYLLNIWETQIDLIEAMLLQGGGGVIDASGVPVIDNEANARVISQIALWTSGAEPIAAEVSFWDATGHQLMRDGFVIATFAPDWMCNYWRKEVPQLSGTMKLMPLPAWDKGGRRTSVWGGTMLGIPRTAKDPEKLWQIAKHLYLSRDLAHKLYERGDIVTPVSEFWQDDIYDKPDPFFMGQPKGRMYINLAPQVPDRFSSPFGAIALARTQSAVSQLCKVARDTKATNIDQLMPKAREFLAAAQEDAMRHVNRNVFFADSQKAAEVTP